MDQETLRWLTDPDSGCWDELGYQRFPLGEPVVIGSGAGGGVAAHVLAAAGCSVLVVERGRALSAADIGWDPVRNHRTAVFGFGESVTPDGNPGLSKTGTASGSSSPTTSATTTTPSCWAAAPGCSAPRRGGSRPRRSTWPANTASRRARPWPTGRSPTTISSPTTPRGVGGGRGRLARPCRRRTPIPRLPATPVPARPLGGDAGRSRGFAGLDHRARSHAGQLAALRRAARVCELRPVRGPPLPGRRQERLPQRPAPPSRRGRRRHLVRYPGGTRRRRPGEVDLRSERGQRTVRADRIVLAAGAVETARLLLLSGLGNDWVGRCLQGHTYILAYGHVDTDEPLSDGIGPGLTIAPGSTATTTTGLWAAACWRMNMWYRRAALGDGVVVPAEHQRAAEAAGETDKHGRPTGASARQALRDTFRRTIMLMGPIQEIPTRSAGWSCRRSAGSVGSAGGPVLRRSA